LGKQMNYLIPKNLPCFSGTSVPLTFHRSVNRLLRFGCSGKPLSSSLYGHQKISIFVFDFDRIYAIVYIFQ
jgi:hypothetical protein